MRFSSSMSSFCDWDQYLPQCTSPKQTPFPSREGKNGLLPAPEENYRFSFTLYFENRVTISPSASFNCALTLLPGLSIWTQYFFLCCWLKLLSGAERVLRRELVPLHGAATQILSGRWDLVLWNKQILCRSP